MNPIDIAKQNLKQGDRVNISSHYDGVIRQAEAFTVVSYHIPTQCVATYFPEANSVVPHNHFATESQTPISKSVVVRLTITG